MTPVPDELARCRCGRSTYLLPGCDALRTCSKCGYLTSYCRCVKEPTGSSVAFRFSPMGDRTRAMLGAGLVSAVATLFVVTLFSSPLFAVLGVGLPLGLSTSFFAEWLRDGTHVEVAAEAGTAGTAIEAARVGGR